MKSALQTQVPKLDTLPAWSHAALLNFTRNKFPTPQRVPKSLRVPGRASIYPSRGAASSGGVATAGIARTLQVDSILQTEPSPASPEVGAIGPEEVTRRSGSIPEDDSRPRRLATESPSWEAMRKEGAATARGAPAARAAGRGCAVPTDRRLIAIVREAISTAAAN